jgi:hypothetical protein
MDDERTDEPKVPVLKLEYTQRGFARVDFKDQYDVECSLQESSLATEDAIWFGCNNADPKEFIPNEGWKPVKMPEEYSANTRMHLTKEQVEALLPFLHRFVETGWLRPTGEDENIG